MRRPDPAEVSGPGQDITAVPPSGVRGNSYSPRTPRQFRAHSCQTRDCARCRDRDRAHFARIGECESCPSAKTRCCSSAVAPTRCGRRTPRPGVARRPVSSTASTSCPAAETLLLDGLSDPEAVLAGIEDWPDDLPEDLEDRLVELPVTYDGPDLESVAEHTGLAVEEVVRAASGDRVRGRVLRVRAGLRLPQRAARGAARAAAGGAAVQGAAGVGGAGRSVHRGLPDGPRPGGWQLIARTDETALGPRPGPAGAAVPGDPGAVHRWLSRDG